MKLKIGMDQSYCLEIHPTWDREFGIGDAYEILLFISFFECTLLKQGDKIRCSTR